MVWDVALGIVLGFVLLALLPVVIELAVLAVEGIWKLFLGIFEILKLIVLSILGIVAIGVVFYGGFMLTGWFGFSETYQILAGVAGLFLLFIAAVYIEEGNGKQDKVK